MNKKVLILGPGGQYNHLILRRVTELGYTAILKEFGEEIKEDFDVIIIGGGPARLNENSKEISYVKELIKLNKPILGICLGHQLISLAFNGKLQQYPCFGPQTIYVKRRDKILENIPDKFTAWESHNDTVIKIPKNFVILAYSEKNKAEIIKHRTKKIYGVQFHPEVNETEFGNLILKNFIEL
ncbi:MAG: gamma-glutamyl-gamma-aminobutyrate hydrolase family protein [Thermoproteota archaeon]|jgi:GMP synthase (glutamine-hydrolysing)|nr:gamma-glutamyl-gamma-aminobutyrate hydrolase family protein [Thermoproteota archaeon]